MAKKDYKKLSDDIIKACGGVDNILSASHCMTRLRMNLKDSSKLIKSNGQEWGYDMSEWRDFTKTSEIASDLKDKIKDPDWNK